MKTKKTMKFKSLFIAAIMLCFTSVVFAQNENYRKLYFSFNTGETNVKGIGVVSNASIKEQLGGIRKLGSMGGALGFSYAFNLKKSEPLFLEVGSELGYYSDKENTTVDNRDLELKTTFMNFQFPINLTYHIQVFDNLRIAPYAGINFKWNLLGKIDIDRQTYDMFETEKARTVAQRFTPSDLPQRLDKNLPAEVDGSFYDGTANRFQFGLNLGVNVLVSDNFYLGYRYQPDLTSYYKFKKTLSGKSGGLTFTSNNHYFSIGVIL